MGRGSTATSCLFSLFSRCFWTGKSFLSIFLLFLLKASVTNIGIINMLCCVLSNHVLQIEMDSNGRFKWEHVESCFLITENIMSPLPHCFLAPNLVGWWLTMRACHDKATWPFDPVVVWNYVTNLKHSATTRVPFATKRGWWLTLRGSHS